MWFPNLVLKPFFVKGVTPETEPTILTGSEEVKAPLIVFRPQGVGSTFRFETFELPNGPLHVPSPLRDLIIVEENLVAEEVRRLDFVSSGVEVDRVDVGSGNVVTFDLEEPHLAHELR